MIVEVSRRVCDGIRLKYLYAAGLAWLEHNRERVNQLNVYPVPDGDTGTNMTLTMRKAFAAVADWEEEHVGRVAEAVAKGALLGARGNSGVILSQILRGFANGVKDRDVFDSATFAYSCKLAAEAAYRAVEKPVEGTILSVAKAAAEAAHRISSEETDLQVILEVMLATAKDALRRTPEQLDILRKAGVVDSGGQGLVYIIEGMARMLQGEPVMLHETLMSGENHADGDTHDGTWQDELEPEDEEGYGYDVQFLMRGQNWDVEKVRRDLEAMGWSTLVVGDESMIKVHIHVHNPADPIGYAITQGAALDDIVVENMQLQYEAQAAKRVKKDLDDAPVIVDGVAVIAVAAGEGLRKLMKELGVSVVVSGGQTMNPSAEDFLSAVNALPNSEIIILPNNKNIVLAAEQAAKLSVTKSVKVVPTRSIPQAVAAMFAYTNALLAAENDDLDGLFGVMRAAMPSVRSAEITTSTKTITLDGVSAQEGQIIGLLDGKLVAAGDSVDGVVEATLQAGDAANSGQITLYFGDAVREAQANRLADAMRAMFPAPEILVVRGAQPLYPYLISIE